MFEEEFSAIHLNGKDAGCLAIAGFGKTDSAKNKCLMDKL
jgi:hypothetical protein